MEDLMFTFVVGPLSGLWTILWFAVYFVVGWFYVICLACVFLWSVVVDVLWSSVVNELWPAAESVCPRGM